MSVGPERDPELQTPTGESAVTAPTDYQTMLAFLRSLGSGVIAGAADIDPTTVATLAVVGATTTYGLAWLIILIIPMLTLVQVISAGVGVVCRTGLEDAIRARFGRPWALLTLLLILAVNILTFAADLEGGSAALHLLTGLPYQWFLLPFALGVGALQKTGQKAPAFKRGMNGPLLFPRHDAILPVSYRSRPGASWRGVRPLEAPGFSRERCH